MGNSTLGLERVPTSEQHVTTIPKILPRSHRISGGFYFGVLIRKSKEEARIVVTSLSPKLSPGIGVKPITPELKVNWPMVA